MIWRHFCGLSPLIPLLLLAGPLSAELVIYEGKLTVDGAAWTGAGRFKFAVVDDRGAEVWASQPMSLQVTGGQYAVRLGDSPQAPPIPAAGAAPRLRIWFERAEKGWAVAGPDVPLTSAKKEERPAADNAAIMAELREIRALLEGKPVAAPVPPAERVTVSIAGAPSLGEAGAPLVLVEYTDYQCPHCINFHRTVFPALKTKYIETGKLRLVSRNLPQGYHAQAIPAAKAARCADRQGKFWEFRERLLSAQGALPPETVRQLASDTGLDPAMLEACQNDPATAAALEQELADAKAAGIVATPTFVLGRLEGDKVTGVKLVGAQSLPRLEIEMRKLLNEGK